MKTVDKLKEWSMNKKLNVNSSLVYFKMRMEELIVEAYKKNSDDEWFEKASDLIKDTFDDAFLDSLIIEQVDSITKGFNKSEIGKEKEK